MKAEDPYKFDGMLPPVREARKLEKINSSTYIAKQIYLNFTGKLDMSTSPKHIRVPKPKRDVELRQSTRSQLASINEKKARNIKLFSLPLEKDYFNRKIKKTVRHYFQARRTSLGHNFNDVDVTKEKRNVQEMFKTDLKNHKITIELDPACIISDKPSVNKALSSRVPSKAFAFTGLSSRDSAASPKEIIQTSTNSQRIEQNKKVTDQQRIVYAKVDQGLQTEEQASNEIKSLKLSDFNPILDFPDPSPSI